MRIFGQAERKAGNKLIMYDEIGEKSKSPKCMKYI